jgi:hypothetical protein
MDTCSGQVHGEYGRTLQRVPAPPHPPCGEEVNDEAKHNGTGPKPRGGRFSVAHGSLRHLQNYLRY